MSYSLGSNSKIQQKKKIRETAKKLIMNLDMPMNERQKLHTAINTLMLSLGRL